MVKKVIVESKSVDWHDALDGMTRGEAVQWILDNVPYNYTLGHEYDYESTYGILETTRLETDEEEATREAAEAAANKERLLQLEWMRMRREKQAEDLVKGQTAIGLALVEYLSKHKDNPNYDNLSNMFTAIAQAELDGHAKNGVVIEQLKECLKRLEGV